MILTLLALLGCAHTGRLQLFETFPVETTLDDPGLPEAHELWRQRIEAADRSIDLMHFYAVDEPGSRLTPVIEALGAAAARGVTIRVLADAGFSKTYPDLLGQLGALPGASMRLLDLKASTGGVLHAKVMLIDGDEVLVGSQNFDWRSLEHIQELGALVQDPTIAAAYGQVFEADWARAGGEALPEATRVETLPVRLRSPAGTVSVLPVFSPKELLPDPALWDLPYLLSWIEEAETSIRLQAMSWETREYGGEDWFDLQEALAAAAARGVKVEVILAHWGLRRSRIEAMRTLARLPGVELRIATIPEAGQGFIPFARVVHSKFLVVDEARAWVGTSNMGRDYFHSSRNAGLLIEGEAVAGSLDEHFERLWTSPYCERLDLERDYPEPRYRE